MKIFVVLVAFLAFSVTESLIAPENFVINGLNATVTPHHVIVEFFNAANLGFFGGGSIITSNHILTSAQNVHTFVRWRVGYGSYRRLEVTWTESTNAVTHPQYAPTTRNNDIAIITLPNHLVFTARVRPIALPPAGLDLPFQNEQGMILGFGFTDGVTNQPADNLRYGYVRVQPDNFCTSIFHIVIPNHFCATDNRFPVNICNGDIGGGFTTFYRSEEILVGVSSMLIENCHIQWPSAYTRVSQYLPWIHQVIGV
ncbi:vitamin K-dependent protein C-like [Phlebotomus papatasi]|uniref:vitamin K-dependent protein C-like n=1 Tax=Phlebotomus papatasi TaxID=29031 RepID=UPI0024839837|nr:vitamin K-dependent protein C-like [Phlebotomus papatasi]